MKCPKCRRRGRPIETRLMQDFLTFTFMIRRQCSCGIMYDEMRTDEDCISLAKHKPIKLMSFQFSKMISQYRFVVRRNTASGG